MQDGIGLPLHVLFVEDQIASVFLNLKPQTLKPQEPKTQTPKTLKL